MFEATRQFFNDGLNFQLTEPQMTEIVRTLSGLESFMSLGEAIHDLCQLTSLERNYISRVLCERDEDPTAWDQLWQAMESEAFD